MKTKQTLFLCVFSKFSRWKIKIQGNSGSEFLSYKIALQNQVMQNDVTLRATNLKLKNKKFHFELPTPWLKFYFFTFELLTQSWKLNSYTSSY